PPPNSLPHAHTVSPLTLNSLPTRRSSDLGNQLAVKRPDHADQAAPGRYLKVLDPLGRRPPAVQRPHVYPLGGDDQADRGLSGTGDRKSTRLNSSHEWISYAVFCLKKKTKP